MNARPYRLKARIIATAGFTFRHSLVTDFGEDEHQFCDIKSEVSEKCLRVDPKKIVKTKRLLQMSNTKSRRMVYKAIKQENIPHTGDTNSLDRCG